MVIIFRHDLRPNLCIILMCLLGCFCGPTNDRCTQQTNCRSCNRRTSSLSSGCGWCASDTTQTGSCTMRVNCDFNDHHKVFYSDKCPPEIHDVNPKIGSTLGGTNVTITGDCFAEAGAIPLVRIGNLQCQVQWSNLTAISCLTQNVMNGVIAAGRNYEVSVQIHDNSQQSTNPHQPAAIPCDGRWISRPLFSYLEPVVTDFQPKSGLSVGGILIMLTGRNLNVGKLREVIVRTSEPKSKPCIIPDGGNNATHIFCQMPPNGLAKSKVALRLFVDGKPAAPIESEFQYLPQPELENATTLLETPIFSGGTEITFAGENLNSFSRSPPVLRVHRPDDPSKWNETNCKVISSTQMICEAPAITSLYPRNGAAESVRLTGNVALHDEPNFPVKAVDLTYYPDPNLKYIDSDLSAQPLTFKEQTTGENADRWKLQFGRPDANFSPLTASRLAIIFRSDSQPSYACSDQEILNGVITCTLPWEAFEHTGMKFRMTVQYAYAYVEIPNIDLARLAINSTAQAVGGTAPHVVLTDTYFLVIGAVSVVLILLVFACCAYTQRAPNSWVRRVSTRVRRSAPGRRLASRRLPQDDQGESMDMESRSSLLRVNTESDVRCPMPGDASKAATRTGRKSNRPRYSIAESHVKVNEVVRRLRLEKYIISHGRLKVHSLIGEGVKGKVYKGTLLSNATIPITTSTVAAKCLHEFHLTSGELVKNFLKECAVMAKLSHANVMRFEGICLNEENGNLDPQLILPFMPNGNLHSFVSSQPPLPLGAILDFSLQIAKGMCYLSSAIPSQILVHRDLAARNCMLDQEMRVVIAEFGLSRDVQQTENATYISLHPQQMAIRWLAPECFEHSQYSTKSDVWSFGVVVWELLTRGEVPYEAIIGPSDHTDRLHTFLTSGKRLAKPGSCSVELYTLMTRCWSLAPANRPDFNKVHFELEGQQRSIAAEEGREPRPHALKPGSSSAV